MRLGYRPIDTPGTEMYHPSNGSPRTANTWGYIAVHEKQEANRAATASHGELPRLPSRERKKKQETEVEVWFGLVWWSLLAQKPFLIMLRQTYGLG
ncbi:hypothetical protein AVEN_235649-1 [Araneus ventricosus]|uniref:Uncharacterized protein n=1 Tax=Araneus ventricosus TaxID=182803 RepID=A0A4Y2BSB8_ARAVE|nr:hypothetical protein AVEN_235649-1 [Araneus ventricosus]